MIQSNIALTSSIDTATMRSASTLDTGESQYLQGGLARESSRECGGGEWQHHPPGGASGGASGAIAEATKLQTASIIKGSRIEKSASSTSDKPQWRFDRGACAAEYRLSGETCHLLGQLRGSTARLPNAFDFAAFGVHKLA